MANKQGKFWEDSTEEEEEDFFSDSEDTGDDTPKQTEAPKPGRWQRGAADPDEFADDKREVRAKTDKANENIEKLVETLRGYHVANDWNNISKEFPNLEKLNKAWQDAWSVDTPAPQFIGYLSELEDFYNDCSKAKDYKKKLSKTNIKTFQTMQQKIKKATTPFAKQIRTFKFNKAKVAAGELDASELYPMPRKLEPLAPVAAEPPKPDEIIWTNEMVEQKLAKIIGKRGRKGYDRKKQLNKLTDLISHSQSSYQTTQIYLNIISIQYDASIASHLGSSTWKECLDVLNKVMDIIETDPSAVQARKPECPQLIVIPLTDNLIHSLERLEQEYYKSLQDLDTQKILPYVNRMKDVVGLVNLTKRVMDFYKKANNWSAVTIASIILLKYLHHNVRVSIQKGDKTETVNFTCEGMDLCSELELEDLAKICFKYGNERQKTHSMLFFIAALANRDQFYRARDLMLMSHLQESIQNADIDTQILYNRAMVCIGLCAFRAGKIVDAHNCLSEICSSARLKELLAQGIVRYNEKAAEQERLEVRRQMPYHMHINLDLLEAVHLVCALLLEVPNSAASSFDKRKPISRTLKKYLEFSNRQIFVGPPENTREVVVAAAKVFSRGDWKKCADLLFSLKTWKVLPEYEKIIEMLTQKLKEEGLRTYMFIASSNYDSLSIDRLATMYALPKNTVHSILSKMMINGELHASWDQPTGSIVMHKVDPSRLQSLALQFSEKVSSFAEANERLLESKTAFGKYDPLKDRYQDQSGWSNRAGRYKPRYNQQNQQNQQRGQRYNKDTSNRRTFRHNN